MSRKAHMVWRSNPRAPTGFPIAAVVWMPDGPAIATVELLSRGPPAHYIGKIGDRTVTGFHDKLSACRAAVAVVVAMAHNASIRRMLHADW